MMELKPYKELTPYEQGEWDMLTLIASLYFGKEYYSLDDKGIAYSRLSHECMSREQAIDEFLKYMEN